MHTTTPAIELPRPRLPVPLTELVGREREVRAVRQLLASNRLLTLTGAGGSGKTRLAIELARLAAEDESRELAWVELGPVVDEALVARTVATALGLREAPGRPAAEVLLECLADRESLLVLDNCEHVIGASAALADQLLRGCPRLRVLATSREPLGVAGEVSWLVPPLSLPAAEAPVEALEASEAVRLFVDRATDALPSFTLSEANAGAVAEICRRLDGIPLAIELAAARVRVLHPREISERLHDAFGLLVSGSRTALPRHRALRTAFDWSYQLLNEKERRVFERLSAFAGGWTISAAESVCAGQDIEPAEVLDLLAALVDKSLVGMREVGGAARYFLLETVRQYAAERLAASGGAEAVHERHARFYLERAREAEPHLITQRRRTWVEALLADVDNLRLALIWTRRHDPAAHLELVGRLEPSGGNWGLEAMRVPQMWNLNGALKKRVANSGGRSVLTAMIDFGVDASHADLDVLTVGANGIGSDHATSVAGVIGANHGNGEGIDGIHPQGLLVAYTVNAVDTRTGAEVSLGDALLSTLDAALRSEYAANTAAIAVSLGYDWGARGIDPDVNPTARTIASMHGALVRDLIAAAAARGPLPVIVTAAGNDSDQGFGTKYARWAGPLANAALEHNVAAIVVVEAVAGEQRAPFSNEGGDVSAPGMAVLTTIPGNQYAYRSGTSLAAGYVAGLISYLYGLAPDMPRPTLTNNRMRAVLSLSGEDVGGGAAPRVDAFGAALALDDLVFGSPVIARMLVDIDDGSEDGNLRVSATGENLEDEEDMEGDGGIGDGRIDMSDFRRWRDWYLDATNAPGRKLDGGPGNAKRDVNDNGRTGAEGDDENVYPRGDFNGDGHLTSADLELLEQLFDEVPYAPLTSLLTSGDVHVSAAKCLAAPGAVRVRSTVYEGETARHEIEHTAGQRPGIFTLADGSDYLLEMQAFDATGGLVGSRVLELAIAPGEDVHLEPDCEPESGGKIVSGTHDYELTVSAGGTHNWVWEPIPERQRTDIQLRPTIFQPFADSAAHEIRAEAPDGSYAFSHRAHGWLVTSFEHNARGEIRSIRIEAVGGAEATETDGGYSGEYPLSTAASGRAMAAIFFEVLEKNVTFELEIDCSASAAPQGAGGMAELSRVGATGRVIDVVQCAATATRGDTRTLSGVLEPGWYRVSAVAGVPVWTDTSEPDALGPGEARANLTIRFR